jgi:hypothetical protein
MLKQFTETHFCNCREGNIYVKKSVITGLGYNQSQQIEGVANIIPCIVCGSTMNSNGYELDKKKETKLI